MLHDRVFVPKQRLGLSTEDGSALKECRVTALYDRKVAVSVQDEDGNDIIVANSAVHKNLHVLILRIGDFQTEDAFLDPMMKSILQYLRMLLTDTYVRRFEVRSFEELQKFWRNNNGSFSHVLIVGHGSPDGIVFGVDGLVTASRLVEVLSESDGSSTVFISIACETGKGEMARMLSSINSCAGFVGPYDTVHGADASLFAQTFLSLHFLSGLTLKVAAKRSYEALSRCTFRLWQNGKLQVGYHVR